MFVKMLTAQVLREVLGRGFDEFHVKAVPDRTVLKVDRVHLEAFVNIGFVDYSYDVPGIVMKVMCGLCHQDYRSNWI